MHTRTHLQAGSSANRLVIAHFILAMTEQARIHEKSWYVYERQSSSGLCSVLCKLQYCLGCCGVRQEMTPALYQVLSSLTFWRHYVASPCTHAPYFTTLLYRRDTVQDPSNFRTLPFPDSIMSMPMHGFAFLPTAATLMGQNLDVQECTAQCCPLQVQCLPACNSNAWGEGCTAQALPVVLVPSFASISMMPSMHLSFGSSCGCMLKL